MSDSILSEASQGYGMPSRPPGETVSARLLASCFRVHPQAPNLRNPNEAQHRTLE